MPNPRVAMLALVVTTSSGCTALGLASPTLEASTSTSTVMLHGSSLDLHFASPIAPVSDTVVVYASGDGGWFGAAIEMFHAIAPEDEPGDYRVLAEFAQQGSAQRPILVGVSEGAGLSLLAATDPLTKAAIGGVIGLGLPDVNELGWRWKDAMIYLTHGVPNEPTFSTTAVAGRVAPAPLAAIHSTRDEFVPVAEVERVMAAANEPKRLWVVEAADHRFSNNLTEFDRRLFEALTWVAQQRGR
ncbi:MAG TPA: alpha/beta hydrolase [Vicinamibacterales bacterium]|nr:alpha/beta hydrolase [Vicinamibacterales bacterium]